MKKFAGHLRKNDSGQYVGVLTDGVSSPIHLVASISEDIGGRFFILDGDQSPRKKPDPKMPGDA